MQDFSPLTALLDSPKRIAIVVHQRPDADALGTGLGLAALLKKQHHQVQVISPTRYPHFLDWLPGVSQVIISAEGQQQASHAFLKQADVIFCVDFPTLNRLNDMEDTVRNGTAVKVIIDHHPTNEQFGDLIFRDIKAAATAEIVYALIEALSLQELMDSDIAECLYAGILTDTGSFRHANTTASTHLIAARLMHYGANVTKVNRLIYAQNSLRKLQFLGFALCHRFVVLPQYRTAYFVIKAIDYARYQLKTGDTEDLVDYALSLKNIVFAAVLKEKQDAVRLSLRSMGEIPVHLWAQAYFSGGGHKNAAGGTSYLSLEATIDKFKSLLQSQQHILNP